MSLLMLRLWLFIFKHLIINFSFRFEIQIVKYFYIFIRKKSFFFILFPKYMTKEKFIAVGNAGNDLTMVQYAGLGIWVDNVDPELRHHADVIVASNNNHGVAEVVRRFILN